MHPITTEKDEYVRELIRQAKMLWKITLTDGTVAWSDPDRYAVESVVDDVGGGQRVISDEPDDLKPWNRLKKYCEEKGLTIKKVQVVCMGAPEEVIWEDEDGLDGVLVKRGAAQIRDTETGYSQAFQNLIVGVLNNNATEIDVRKYSWPFNELEPYNQKRKVTPENLGEMIFKPDSEKLKLINV